MATGIASDNLIHQELQNRVVSQKTRLSLQRDREHTTQMKTSMESRTCFQTKSSQPEATVVFRCKTIDRW